MPNIQVKDSFGRNVFIKATGSGSENDPYIPTQEVTILNETLPLAAGAATNQAVNDVKLLSEISLGQLGHTLVTNTADQTGSWSAIQVVETANFASLTCAYTSSPAINIELPVGFILYGNITAFKLIYGKVIAYKRV